MTDSKTKAKATKSYCIVCCTHFGQIRGYLVPQEIKTTPHALPMMGARQSNERQNNQPLPDITPDVEPRQALACMFCMASSSSKKMISPPANAKTTCRSLAHAFSICFLPGARHSCGGCPFMMTRNPCEYTWEKAVAQRRNPAKFVPHSWRA